MFKVSFSILRSERGATAVEYVGVACMLMMLCLGSITQLQGSAEQSFYMAASGLSGTPAMGFSASGAGGRGGASHNADGGSNGTLEKVDTGNGNHSSK
ncbi:MAG: hypothetical protein KDD66_14965 [Bdellovibrionales bacterium]|nr:hypothetical protein [Bdellovibrionales bacterium]